MKIIKFFKYNKILDLKFIKNKIYENKQNKLNQIKLQLKKNFKILFKFYLFNKKILFLGTENKLNSFFFNFIKNNKHFFLPQNIWFRGILTNSGLLFKYLLVSQSLNLFLKFLLNLNKTNLAVIFNTKKQNELLSLKIPTLTFNNFNNSFCDYKLNYFSKERFNVFLFCFGLNSLEFKVKKFYKKSANF